MTDEFDDLCVTDEVISDLITEARWRSYGSEKQSETWWELTDPELFESLTDYVDFLWVELRHERQRADKLALDIEHMVDGHLFAKVEAERDALEANRDAWISDAFRVARKAESERDAIFRAIKPVLDAWNIPGISPQYHDARKSVLRREWFMLYHAVDDLCSAVESLKEEK